MIIIQDTIQLRSCKNDDTGYNAVTTVISLMMMIQDTLQLLLCNNDDT